MSNNYKLVKKELFNSSYTLEIGKLSKQASGAVLASCGETTVLATVVASSEKAEGEDFLPLTINYQEKSYAAGRIPGGYFKREGRPSEQEILNSRLIDRPIRPLISKDFTYPTQVIVTVLSADQDNNPDVLSITAASAAIMVSDIPFEGPLAGVRVGRIEGELTCNPSKQRLEDSDIDLIVAGTKEAIVMVEGGSNEVPESDIIDALMFAHNCLKDLIDLQYELIEGIDIQKRVLDIPEVNEDLVNSVNEFAGQILKENIKGKSKSDRGQEIKNVKKATLENLLVKYPEEDHAISNAFDKLLKDIVREMIVNEKIRLDNRDFTTVRDITGEVGFLHRIHGSGLFTRGETQAAVFTTLGTAYDEQRVDSLDGEMYKNFMLHYNFPPFSVGEVGGRLGPGRREIGHGALAARSILPVLPSKDDFPYTIRIVSEILESNGSSSMATVCGSSLSLMDAGVPISSPVGGIAMGLIKEDDQFVILSDILGDEDHLGDMDFKVCGTNSGITALQMDIKVTGITKEILEKALNQAYVARIFVLDKMNQIISEPREDISKYAPRIFTMMLKPEKIKDVIGPGGKTIKKIIEVTGVQIDIEDSGRVNIASTDADACNNAIKYIEELVQEIEVGKIYIGNVKRILDFGAIVELKNGKDGLVHISELERSRVNKVTDILQEGDELLVKCIGKEGDGKIRLSRKEALGENIEEYKSL